MNEVEKSTCQKKTSQRGKFSKLGQICTLFLSFITSSMTLCFTGLWSVCQCVKAICKPAPMAESLPGARSWLALQTRLVRDFNNEELIRYHEFIPETNILALIVHKLICSWLNQNCQSNFDYHIEFFFFLWFFVGVKSELSR